MGEERDVWATALADARLSADEHDRLTRARDDNAALAEEVKFLVTHLRANLSGEFLRALADNLRTGLDPELCVVRSLRQTIATSALLVDQRELGGGG